jgi:hypothetical protein
MFPWAKFRRAKGGVKAHVLLDHDDYLPAYVLLSSGAKYDLQITQDEPEAGQGVPQVAGFKHVSGLVWSTYDPYFVLAHSRKIMTLQMEDGRKLRFVHRDIDGSIGLNKWLG